MQESKPPYFDPKTVSTTYYINIDKSTRRKESMEKMAQDIGLNNLVRVPGVYGRDLKGEEYAHAIRDTVVDMGESTTLHEQQGIKRYTPESTLLDQNLALGKYGCQASHLKAMKTALASLRPEDENKWVVILEDDAKLVSENRDKINAALKDAPEDAGAIMLGALQFLDRGQVPVTSSKENLVLPMYAHSCLGIAYRPDMLRLLVKLYERNLTMTTEEGGITPVDNVTCNIQLASFGLSPHENVHANKTLLETFDKESKEIFGEKSTPANRFYLCNPGTIIPEGKETFIGSNTQVDHVYYYGQKLVPWPEEAAVSLHKKVMSISGNPKMLRTANEAVRKACVDQTITPEEATKTIDGLVSAYGRINSTLASTTRGR